MFGSHKQARRAFSAVRAAANNAGTSGPPYNVVVTGSTKGIGLALARKHLELGVATLCYNAIGWTGYAHMLVPGGVSCLHISRTGIVERSAPNVRCTIYLQRKPWCR